MQALTPRSAWTLFLVSIVLLGGLAFYANRSVERYTDSERWVSHIQYAAGAAGDAGESGKIS